MLKRGQKLTAVGGDLGGWQLQDRNPCSPGECRTGLFGTISLLENFREGGRRGRGPDRAGLSWRLQLNVSQSA